MVKKITLKGIFLLQIRPCFFLVALTIIHTCVHTWMIDLKCKKITIGKMIPFWNLFGLIFNHCDLSQSPKGSAVKTTPFCSQAKIGSCIHNTTPLYLLAKYWPLFLLSLFTGKPWKPWVFCLVFWVSAISSFSITIKTGAFGKPPIFLPTAFHKAVRYKLYLSDKKGVK